jgi:Zn-dependent peptidase ImmA (M78 family)
MALSPVETAIKLLDSIGLEDVSNTSIEDLIFYHNGLVREVLLENCDGRMVMKNGHAIVSIDSGIEFPQKKRFVLAHELGHMLLHANKEASFTDDYETLEAYKKGKQEAEAYAFASELLMPQRKFQEHCFKKKFSPDLIRSLSDRFNTSITSVAYRFVEFGNHPIALFYSKDSKVQYWKKSNDFKVWVPEINKLNVPSDSVANEFYTSGKIYSKDKSKQQIWKSTWFTADEDDTKMYEYCIITPRYNTVLSIVWED